MLALSLRLLLGESGGIGFRVLLGGSCQAGSKLSSGDNWGNYMDPKL